MKNHDPADKNKFCKNKNPNPGDEIPEKILDSRDYGLWDLKKLFCLAELKKW